MPNAPSRDDGGEAETAAINNKENKTASGSLD